MSMPSYLNPFRHIDCFPAFTRSRKPKSGHLIRAQTKYQTNFCHFGTYLLSCHGWYQWKSQNFLNVGKIAIKLFVFFIVKNTRKSAGTHL